MKKIYWIGFVIFIIGLIVLLTFGWKVLGGAIMGVLALFGLNTKPVRKVGKRLANKMEGLDDDGGDAHAHNIAEQLRKRRSRKD